MTPYEQRWSFLTTGHNAARAARWRLIHWNDIKPGDVVTYVDDMGRSCAGLVASKGGEELTTRPAYYKGHLITPPQRVVHLDQSDLRRYAARGVKPPSFFRYAERELTKRRRKKKPFRPLTLGRAHG